MDATARYGTSASGRRRVVALAALLALTATACSGGAAPPREPRVTTTTAPPPRAVADLDSTRESIGDPLAPGLGNGGYDVTAYDVALEWNPETGRIVATSTITATATEALDAFDLDFEGFVIHAVTVNGAPAATERAGMELAVTPETPIPAGAEFSVVVDYEGSPTSRPSSLARHDVGWITASDGTVYVSADPDGAQLWTPVNGHPLDRADWTIDLTVPNEFTAIASGSLARTIRGIGVTNHRWSTPAPIGPQSVTVVIGEHPVVRSENADAATRVAFRHLLPADLAEEPPAVLDRLPAMVDFLEQRLGAFPYPEFGVAVFDASTPPPLPAGTWALLTPDQLEGDDAELRLIADLARQWFGVDVAARTWSEVWLTSAIPLYASWMWLESQRGTPTLGVVSRAARSEVKQSAWPAPDDPVRGDIYADSTFIYGAVYLHALRLKIGDRAFFELLRTLHDDNAAGVITTGDLVTATYDVSGQNLGYFIDAWFAADPLPGFPAA